MGKQLFGALVGALIGVVLMIVLERMTGKEFGWTVIPIGILVGLGARVGVKHPSFVRGAFAAFLTLVSFAGGKLCASYLDQQATPAIEQVVATDEADDDDAATSEDEDVADEPEDRPLVPSQPSAPGQNFSYESPKELNVVDIACLVIGAAIAYGLGRGADEKPEAAAQTSPSDGDEPASPAPEGE